MCVCVYLGFISHPLPTSFLSHFLLIHPFKKKWTLGYSTKRISAWLGHWRIRRVSFFGDCVSEKRQRVKHFLVFSYRDNVLSAGQKGLSLFCLQTLSRILSLSLSLSHILKVAFCLPESLRECCVLPFFLILFFFS